MWYPGSGVVLDCIDSWSLPPFIYKVLKPHLTDWRRVNWTSHSWFTRPAVYQLYHCGIWSNRCNKQTFSGKDKGQASCAGPDSFVRGISRPLTFFSGEIGSKYHYKRHHRLTSEMPFKWCLQARRWWPNIEWWLGSFVIFGGSGPVLPRNSIFLWFLRPPCPPPPPLDPPMSLNSYKLFWKLIL